MFAPDGRLCGGGPTTVSDQVKDKARPSRGNVIVTSYARLQIPCLSSTLFCAKAA